MAYGFRPIFWENLDVMWFVCDCVMVKDQFYRVSGLSETEHCVLGWQNPEQNDKRGGVPKFPHTLVNRPRQLWTAITFSSELRFARSWTPQKDR